MNTIQSIVTSPAAQVLGWALLHFLWQGALIAVVLKVLLRGIPVRLAGLRYWVASAALMAMLWLPVISIWKAISARTPAAAVQVDAAPSIEPMVSATQIAAARPVSARPGAIVNWQRVVRERLGALVPWISIFWSGGAVLMASVMLGGMVRTQFLRRSARSLTGEGWTRKLTTLMPNARFCEPVRLLETDRVGVPTVIGWLRPAILLPLGAADELAAEHLDALLAHELAHIRRRDYLFNLFQTSIEVLLWFHPATWWVSLQVRAERECCCDDDAVAACGNPLTYARALSRAERLRTASNWSIALSGASLLNRVRRLTEMKTPNLSRVAVCLIGSLAIGLILAAGAGSSLLAYVPAIVERPATVAMSHPSEQIVLPELPVTVRAVPKIQAAIETKTVQSVPAQEKFVRPTEVPQEIKPETELRNLETLLTAKRQQLEELSARYTQNHPYVLQVKVGIAELEKQITTLRRQVQLRATMEPQSVKGDPISALSLTGLLDIKIIGFVYDPTGAVVPGVGISVVSPEDKRVLTSARSDGQGFFEIDAVSGLDFELRFEHPGFALQVLASRNLGTGPLAVTLELGQIKETVTVITGAPTGAASAATNSPIRVGGNIVAPKLIRRVDPVYPPQAKANNIEGIIVVSALIDEEGQVKDAVVLSGHTMLKDAALECVRQWRYSPALINGQPWPMRLSITLVFKLVR